MPLFTRVVEKKQKQTVKCKSEWIKKYKAWKCKRENVHWKKNYVPAKISNFLERALKVSSKTLTFGRRCSFKKKRGRRKGGGGGVSRAAIIILNLSHPFLKSFINKIFQRIIPTQSLKSTTEPCRPSKMELFAKIDDSFQPLIIFDKISLLPVWLRPEYASVQHLPIGFKNGGSLS